MEKKSSMGSLFSFEGKPSLAEMVPMSLQHVIAMVVGCITPAIIVGGASGLNTQDPHSYVLLIQMSLVISGVQTLIQLFLGAKLPVIIGASFAYVPTMSAIAGAAVAGAYGPIADPKEAIAIILGAQLVGGIVAFVFGLFVKWLLPLFPPLVTGTVVFTIGLSLYPIAVRYIGGGGSVKVPGFGDPKNIIVGLLTLGVVVFLNNFGKGILKLASILVGVLVGYVICIPLGMVNFAGVGKASWVAIATPMHFGIKFVPEVIISFVILFIVNSVQAIGDLTATSVGGMDRVPTEKELQGGICAYGIGNILGAVTGCLPSATYSQNVGIVGQTKVINRTVFTSAAVLMIIAGVVPKFSAILTTIPYPVLGGATISVFASIAMTGIKLIATQPLSNRNTGIVGLSVALGMGVTTVASEAINAGVTFLPGWTHTVFGTSPVVLATLVCILLNVIIPKRPEDLE